MATPAPPSAAAALTEAADKRQGPTAPPVQASALSSALPGTSQDVATDSHTAGQGHQVSMVAITTAEFVAGV